MEVNCAVDCQNGCVLGEEKCPNREYRTQASKFIEETSLDTMLEMAEAAVRRRMLERAAQPTQWVFPEDGIRPE